MQSIVELEEALSRPSSSLVESFQRLEGDLLVLGAGGKLGPNIVRLALRANQAAKGNKKVFAASRFGDSEVARALAADGAVVLPGDLTDPAILDALPDAANVVFLISARFGSTGRESYTWFANAYFPGRVAERFKRSRIVALSTGNVYPLTPIASGGPTERTPPNPVGEYGMSCLGRERVMSHLCSQNHTPLTIIRLNYAVEMRYGPIVDIALAIRAHEAIDVTMGFVNVVWQGYANEVILRSLLHAGTPPCVLNVAGPETVPVRQLACQLGEQLRIEPVFAGTEASSALLSNGGYCHQLFGYPTVSLSSLIENTASWVAADLPVLPRRTGFQNRSGKF